MSAANSIWRDSERLLNVCTALKRVVGAIHGVRCSKDSCVLMVDILNTLYNCKVICLDIRTST